MWTSQWWWQQGILRWLFKKKKKALFSPLCKSQKEVARGKDRWHDKYIQAFTQTFSQEKRLLLGTQSLLDISCTPLSLLYCRLYVQGVSEKFQDWFHKSQTVFQIQLICFSLQSNPCALLSQPSLPHFYTAWKSSLVFLRSSGHGHPDVVHMYKMCLPWSLVILHPTNMHWKKIGG